VQRLELTARSGKTSLSRKFSNLATCLLKTRDTCVSGSVGQPGYQNSRAIHLASKPRSCGILHFQFATPMTLFVAASTATKKWLSGLYQSGRICLRQYLLISSGNSSRLGWRNVDTKDSSQKACVKMEIMVAKSENLAGRIGIVVVC
jgi:hypothetical protein